MKSKQTFYAIKHLYTGMFWNDEHRSWMIPKTRLDVYLIALADEHDRLSSIDEEWNDALKNIPEHDKIDCILTTIIVETDIIF